MSEYCFLSFCMVEWTHGHPRHPSVRLAGVCKGPGSQSGTVALVGSHCELLGTEIPVVALKAPAKSLRAVLGTELPMHMVAVEAPAKSLCSVMGTELPMHMAAVETPCPWLADTALSAKVQWSASAVPLVASSPDPLMAFLTYRIEGMVHIQVVLHSHHIHGLQFFCRRIGCMQLLQRDKTLQSGTAE